MDTRYIEWKEEHGVPLFGGEIWWQIYRCFRDLIACLPEVGPVTAIESPLFQERLRRACNP